MDGTPGNNTAAGQDEDRKKKEGDDTHTKPPLSKTWPFWTSIIELLATGQLFLSSSNIFQPFKKTLDQNKLSGIPKYLASNLFSLIFGSMIAATTGFYAKRNVEAIKSLYTDTVAIELGKDKKDVSLMDIFKTKNSVISGSVKEFKRTNILRSMAISTFFIPWYLLSRSKEKPYNIQTAIGSGFMALYLFGTRLNTSSFLEAMQTMIDAKLHHNSDQPYEVITGNDIGNLLILHRKSLDKSYHHPPLGTAESMNEAMVAERIADLLNHTYGNIQGQNASFTLGKFIYLLGNEASQTGKGFLDQPFPLNLAYIEIANKYDIEEVSKVVESVRNGMPIEEVLNKYAISLPENLSLDTHAHPARSFSERLAASRTGGQYAKALSSEPDRPRTIT